MNRLLFVAFASGLLVACGGTDLQPTDPNGLNTLIATSAAGAEDCPNGGVRLQLGLDRNRNGVLDASEVQPELTREVCNGQPSTVAGPTGPRGAEGPQGIQGPEGPQGDPGPTGATGPSGLTLVATSSRFVGAQGPCTVGGVRIELGLDANVNGALDPTEVDAALTQYVCDASTDGITRISDADLPSAIPQADANFSIAGTGSAGTLISTGALVAQGEVDGAGTGGVPQEGAGTRMMWCPEKAAFRSGTVSGAQWDAANVGNFSFASGEDVTASGDHSVAIGVGSSALSPGAVALGEGVVAEGEGAIALGYNADSNNRKGSFVFADRSTDEFVLRAGVNNSANWRVANGFRIFTSPDQTTGVTIQKGSSISNWGQSAAVISTSTGAMLTIGGVWQNASDVHRKHDFEEVSPEDVLERVQALPITE